MTLITVSNSYQELILKPSMEHETCSRKAQFVVTFQHKVVTLKGNVNPV